MRTCYAIALGLSSLTSALNGLQAQNSSGLLDTTSTETRLVRNGVLTANGDVVLSLISDAGLWLWSCDGAGTPLWSNSYGTDTLWATEKFPLIVCADGTLVFAYLGSQVDVGDSTVITVHVVRILPGGSVVWDKEISIIPNEIWSWQSWVSLTNNGLGLIETSDHDLVLTMRIHQQVQYTHMNLTRLDADGTLLWSKYIGYEAQPVFTEWNEVGPIGADATGGCVLAWVPNTGGEVTVARLDAAGALQWTTTSDYALSAMEFQPLDVVTDANGRIIITSSMMSEYTDLQRMILDGSGQHIRTDGYDDEIWWLTEARSVPLASGTALISGNSFMQFDDDGGVVTSLSMSNGGANDVGDYSFGSRAMDVRAGQVLASGDQSLSPFLPGLDIYTPGYIKNQIDAPGQCAHAGWDPILVPIGNELFTFTPDTGIHVVDAPMTLTDGPGVVLPMPVIGTSALCSTVGLAESDRVPGFEVINNLVASGGTLLFRSDVPLDIHLTDALGATVAIPLRSRNTGLTEIPVGDLSSGVYIVVARDVTGRVAGTAKVVVE